MITYNILWSGFSTCCREIQKIRTTHGFKHALEFLVLDSILQRDVDGIAFPSTPPSVILRSRPRKILTKLVKAARHDAVSSIKCLLHSVTMMAVDVDIQYARVRSKKLQNSENNVVYIAKA